MEVCFTVLRLEYLETRRIEYSAMLREIIRCFIAMPNNSSMFTIRKRSTKKCSLLTSSIGRLSGWSEKKIMVVR